MKKGFLFLVVICLAVGMGLSQQRTGNIYGTVVTDDDAPMGIPGTLVTLTSDLIGKMTTVSDEDGNFRFISLSPGMYEVQANLDGFAVYTQKNIQVRLGGNVSLKLTMVPEKLKAEIVVTAAPQTMDSRKTTHATNLTSDEMQSLPTARDPFVILELTPGMVLDRANIGGSESGQQSHYVSGGTGRAAGSWNTDGVNTTDQISRGAAPQYYDFDAFEEIQIQTAAADITSVTAGAQINMITKRGGNRFSGGGRFYLTNEDFQAENAPDGFPEEYTPVKIKHIGDYGLNIGGPIFKDKLWFWIGGAQQDIQKYAVVKDAEGNDIVQTQLINNLEIKLNTILGKHRFEGFFNFSEKTVEGRVSNSHLDAWEAHYNQTSPHPFYKIQDEFTVGENLFISAKAGFFAGGYTLSPIGPLGGITYYDADVKRYWGTYRETEYINHQWFYQLMGNLFINKLLGASHEAKFGVEYKFFPGIRNRTYYSQRLYYKYYNSPTDNDSYRAYIYRNSDRDFDMDRLSAFFEDSINLKKLTILLGLRFDLQGGKINPMEVAGTSVDWAGEHNLDSVSIHEQELNFDWRTISPRIGLIYDFSDEGKTLLKLNFGIYGEHFPSGFLADLGSTYGYVRFSWDDKNMDELASADEVKYYRTYDSYNQTDPELVYASDLASPKTLEFTAGMEHELVKDFALGATFIYRKMYDRLQTLYYVDDNGTERLPTPDDWVIGGTMPAEYGGYSWWEYKEGIEETSKPWNLNNKEYYQQYMGFELSFKKRLSAASKWMVNGSFTLQNWTRHYPSRNSYFNNYDPTNHEPVELLDGNPHGYTAASYTEAIPNPRWMAKLGVMVQLPLKINLSGTLVARDGFILPKYYEDRDVERNGIGDNPDTYISSYGEHRLESTYILNMRLERGFSIASTRVTFSLDAFNVFNSNYTVDEPFDVTSSNYGEPILITSPRIFRLGVRLNF